MKLSCLNIFWIIALPLSFSGCEKVQIDNQSNMVKKAFTVDYVCDQIKDGFSAEGKNADYELFDNGKGAVFRLTLPLDTSDPSEVASVGVMHFSSLFDQINKGNNDIRFSKPSQYSLVNINKTNDGIMLEFYIHYNAPKNK